MKTTFPLRSFRLVCSPEEIPYVEALLHAQGFRFVPEDFSSWARRLVLEPFPLGASFAARFGYIYIQDRSSMLPPLALAPEPGASVLDMCASPGSKTGFLAQLAGNSGFILGNEPSRNRLATLRRNMNQLNLLQCATSSYEGDVFPAPPEGGWAYIQLDPPCSGWGTVEKNPHVLSLWQGDKVKPLEILQRKLLRRAYALLRPGGRLVYSTCTTNIDENERQLACACDEAGFEFVPLSPPTGVAVEDSLDPRFTGCLRIATSEDAQGFFVACLQKPVHAPFVAEAEKGLNSRQEPVRSGRYKGRVQRTAFSWLEAERISPTSLEGHFFDRGKLPDGELAVYNGVVHFLPRAAKRLLPETAIWKGFPLGKVSGAGGIKLSASLRCCMPSLFDAQKAGLAVWQEDTAPCLEALLSGQSVPAGTTESCIGLYFQNLPLCLLSVKGKRVMLPPAQM